MTFQVFNANGSWSWPADVTHAHYQIWGGGGGGAGSTTTDAGGGGEGGDKTYGVVYKRVGASSLSITIGAGGAGGIASSVGNDGGDSKITQSGVDEAVGRGGAHGFFGGRAESIGGASRSSGAGGKGLFNTGGGGGASGPGGEPASYDPVDGQDGASPTPDLFHEADVGFGGTPSPGGGGGRGGNGGGLGDGNDGSVPGGAGGGAGPDVSMGGGGHTGGDGAHGRVILKWSTLDGITLASSGCCCGICDLSKGAFPQAVSVSFGVTPDDPPGFDPDPHTVPAIHVDDALVAECCVAETPYRDFDQASPGTFDANAISHAATALVAGAHPSLEMVDFVANAETASHNGGAFGLYHYCQATYACPLADPSIDDGKASTGFLDRSDRWCPVGTAPDATYDSDTCLVSALDNIHIPNYCYTVEYFAWLRRGTVRVNSTVTLKLWRRFSDAKFGYVVSTQSEFFYPAQADYYGFARGVPGGDLTHGTAPGLTAWGLQNLVYKSGGDPALTSSVEGGDFDTPEEALAAARGAVGNIGAIFADWYDGDGTQLAATLTPDTGGLFAIWTETDDWVCCDVGGVYNCNNDYSFTFENHLHKFDYASAATAAVSW
jgi:hypothetical protein